MLDEREHYFRQAPITFSYVNNEVPFFYVGEDRFTIYMIELSELLGLYKFCER